MKETVKKIINEFKLNPNEAEMVVATLLKKPRFELFLNGNIDENLKLLLRMEIIQLKNGVPIEYITKEVQFFKYKLKIEPGVFIPRLETEYFVELIAKLIDFKPTRICDIGTGCGAIAIALAELFPEAEIIATDISETALNNARKNIQTLNLSKRIDLIQVDLLSSFKDKSFDLIVSNPPYIPTERIKFLPKSVRDFEPRKALDGGFGGLNFIRRLIDESSKYLKNSGAVCLEIDEESVSAFSEYLKNKNVKFKFLADLFDKTRYLFIGNFLN